MGQNGELPKRLSKAVVPKQTFVPMCVACQYGKVTKRPWRIKIAPNAVGKHQSITQPGD